MANMPIPKIYVNKHYEALLQRLIIDLNYTLNPDKPFTGYNALTKYPDIHIINNHEISDERKSSAIGIDEIKQLQKELLYYPLNLPYQIGIIFYAQELTVQAQNSMLKMLEESRPHTLLYLLADTDRNLLKTITSRCQIIYCSESEERSDMKKDNKNAYNFLQKSLDEKFAYIDEIVLQEKKSPGKIDEFLLDLLIYGQDQLKKGVNPRTVQIIKSINKARDRIDANTNKKSSLKNMALEISI